MLRGVTRCEDGADGLSVAVVGGEGNRPSVAVTSDCFHVFGK
jgi:hypothetical protein